MVSIGTYLSTKANEAKSSSTSSAAQSSSASSSVAAASALSTRATSTVPALSVKQLAAYGSTKTDLQNDAVWSAQPEETRKAAWAQIQAMQTTASSVVSDRALDLKSTKSIVLPDDTYAQRSGASWGKAKEAKKIPTSIFPGFRNQQEWINQDNKTASEIGDIIGRNARAFGAQLASTTFEVARIFLETDAFFPNPFAGPEEYTGKEDSAFFVLRQERANELH